MHYNLKYVPQKEWVHIFVHILYIVPRNWYIELGLRRGIITWEEMCEKIVSTFTFEDDSPSIDASFHIIKRKVFEDVSLPNFYNQADWDL